MRYDYSETIQLLEDVLSDVEYELDEGLTTEVRHFIEFNEFGLAYELLEAGIKDKDIGRNDFKHRTVSRMQRLKEIMGME